VGLRRAPHSACAVRRASPARLPAALARRALLLGTPRQGGEGGSVGPCVFSGQQAEWLPAERRGQREEGAVCRRVPRSVVYCPCLR